MRVAVVVYVRLGVIENPSLGISCSFFFKEVNLRLFLKAAIEARHQS